MITEVKDYKTSYDVPDKFIKKIITKSDIVQDILDWVMLKKEAEERKELKGLNKGTLNPRKIEKFSDANKKGNREDCILFLTEGDSAQKAILSASDKTIMGSYPLKGI